MRKETEQSIADMEADIRDILESAKGDNTPQGKAARLLVALTRFVASRDPGRLRYIAEEFDRI